MHESIIMNVMTMNETQSALWKKLESFNLNEGGETFTFEMRLARENNWPSEYTNRVMTEYRRFLFLCASADHPCSPSDQVDQAWHLHLTYTRSYWTRLCGEILPQPLHHEPTKGGIQEDVKFDDWYERTLASYRIFFGSEPPLDIWPPTHLRFEPLSPTPMRADIWTLSKARVKRAFAAFGASAFAGLAAIGCNSGDKTSGLILVIGAAILILTAIAYSLEKQGTVGKRRHGDSSDGCGGGGGSDSGCGGGSDGGHSHAGHGCGGHGGGHGCGGSHGCGGHGCGGHGCGGGGCGGGGH